MKILFHTNIIGYGKKAYPRHLKQVPRRGDIVRMDIDGSTFKKPAKLEVVLVEWFDKSVVCHLDRMAQDKVEYNKRNLELCARAKRAKQNARG